jgi:hypothetical protein
MRNETRALLRQVSRGRRGRMRAWNPMRALSDEQLLRVVHADDDAPMPADIRATIVASAPRMTRAEEAFFAKLTDEEVMRLADWDDGDDTNEEES